MNFKAIKILFLFYVFAIATINVMAQRKTCIDNNWKFFLGDGSTAICQPQITQNWRTLDLPQGMETARRLREAVRIYDQSRPVTAAICTWDEGDEWYSSQKIWELLKSS